ncbi:GIY-YIG nuclease family protein [Halorussus amylolyticus]|uniref:GIY-YIG nuclease family protein n=1 Tax=Halorussus amylolyticus TaxID=1126242 RepID=UPI001048889B|nr:GIY-YIG nuclease family protein [Halorussus amylolyticus]
MAEGTYTLLVELPTPETVEFGARGERDLSAGWYAYTGSAFGPGGFARVERHRELARGERGARHWHVDYLLGHPETEISAVVKSTDADVECAVSRAIDTEAVAGIGASDCDCDSHLRYAPDRERLESAVRDAHASARSGARE